MTLYEIIASLGCRVEPKLEKFTIHQLIMKWSASANHVSVYARDSTFVLDYKSFLFLYLDICDEMDNIQ